MLGFVELDGLAGYKGMFCNNSLLYIPTPNFIAQLTLLSCFVACIFVMSWRFCKIKSTDLKYLLEKERAALEGGRWITVSSIYSNLYHRIYFCIYYFHVGNIQLKKNPGSTTRIRSLPQFDFSKASWCSHLFQLFWFQVQLRHRSTQLFW
jgi:hypothetical protein